MYYSRRGDDKKPKNVLDQKMILIVIKIKTIRKLVSKYHFM